MAGEVVAVGSTQIAWEKGKWFSENHRTQALQEYQALEAANALALSNRAKMHLRKIQELWSQDLALREYAEFPTKFAKLGLPTNPTPSPIQILECEHGWGCRRIWLSDGIPVKLGEIELFRVPGWAHLRTADLDSEYPVPASGLPLYFTIAALQKIVPREQIMVLVEQEHERPRPEFKPDPLLVVRAGTGYYLVARWK